MENASSDSSTVHVPVLPAEIMQLGQPNSGQTWVDGTAGGGGHTRLIADAIGESGRMAAIDRDPAAVLRLEQVLPKSVHVLNESYDQLPETLAELGWLQVDGVLLDLGLSSDQLADRERGFSFQTDGELDMRFNPTVGEPAWEWLRRVDEKTLADTIYRYGEERFSRRIAKRIVETRRADPIRTADQLRQLIYRCVPNPRGKMPVRGKSRSKGKRNSRNASQLDPATRTFQALRIEVNDELGILERAVKRLPDLLAPGGKLLIISFHSLEDRIVKYAFREDERLDIVTKKPVQAAELELQRNPRARSAKLRVAVRRPDHS